MTQFFRSPQYGFGGYWDDLTETRGFDDFSWDGTYAWTNYRYDYCSAEKLLDWVARERLLAIVLLGRYPRRGDSTDSRTPG